MVEEQKEDQELLPPLVEGVLDALPTRPRGGASVSGPHLARGGQTPLRARRGIFFVLERLLQQVPEQFSRDYYDTKK